MTSTLYNPNTTSPHPSTFFPQLTKCKTLRDLRQLHAILIKTGRVKDPLAAAEILRFTALSRPPNRDIHYAHKVFDKMPKPNCFSYNTMIRALSESDDNVYQMQALALFCLMLENEFVQPNRFTFPSVLKACAKLGLYEDGKQVHCMVIKYGLEDDEYVVSNLVRMYVMCGVMGDAYLLFNMHLGGGVLWNVMIDGYVRMGDCSTARKMFDDMPRRSVVSWNSMISGYAQNGFFKEAIELFREMQMGEGDVSPNYVTLVSVLPAISRLGALEMGKWVHLFALRNEIEIDERLGSALIDMYSKCGSVEKALQVFESLPVKNVITWNAIITGLSFHGRGKEAIDHFWRMQEVGVAASDVSYISVLSACSHAGLVSEGRAIFDHMLKVAGLKPRIEHYGCIVDLLGRAGHLNEAEQVVLDMPFEPDDVILKALLAACKMHNNIEMGKRVAKLLMNKAPNDSGSYVALSNMYASLQNWEEVAEVRLLMKEINVRKDPGCSWIEIDGEVHEFLVEDDSHPRANEICSMLEELSKKLSLLGYRPNTTQVLLKLDDEDKASALHYHSEKLALAFGLISTNSKTTFRIVKNLRICDDCHSTMKLVSKLYKREILVRDRKRFHHFENGSCSCMDYW